MLKRLVLLFLIFNFSNNIFSHTITMTYFKSSGLRSYQDNKGCKAYRDYKGYYYARINKDNTSNFTLEDYTIVGQDAYEIYNNLEKEFGKKKYNISSKEDNDTQVIITKYYCERNCP